jgi:hypothetical protein
MNSWNGSESLAYNLKIYNVIDKDLQDKVYEMLGLDEFYDDINALIREFDWFHNYEWQAGFNGRSGGYLVLYKGGIRDGRPYSRPGVNIEDDEVPTHVKKAFRKLALDIVKHTEYMAKHYVVAEEEVTKIEKIKVLKEAV